MISLISIRARILESIVPVLMVLSSSTHANADGYFLNATGFDDTIIVEHNSRLWIQFGDDTKAQRLTNTDVEEVTPVISPNSLFVAYVADAGAHLEVFTTEIGTGITERLTFEAGYNVEVQGWLNETEIMFSSVGVGGKRGPMLFAVDKNTKITRVLPLLEAAEGCLLQDNFIFVKNQPLLDNIKLYEGGYAQQIYTIQANAISNTGIDWDISQTSRKLSTRYDGISRSPICMTNRIFFLTDRSGHFNIWSMDSIGQNLKQHTFGEEYDIRTISLLDEELILYSMIGGVYRFDPADGTSVPVVVNIPPDSRNLSEEVTLSALDAEEFQVSDDAKLVTLIIRGKLWALNLTTMRSWCLECASGTRVRAGQLAADTKTVYALSDKTGEYELYAYDLFGETEPTKIQHGISSPILDFSVSP